MVIVRSVGIQKFYVGLYAENVFQSLHSQNPSAFPFAFGSDRKEFEESYIIRIPGQHRVVVRLGVFTPSGSTNLSVEIIEPPLVG